MICSPVRASTPSSSPPARTSLRWRWPRPTGTAWWDAPSSYRHLTVHGVSSEFTRVQEMAGTIASLLPEVIPAVARGEIRPVIDQTVDFADFQQAANRLVPAMRSARSS